MCLGSSPVMSCVLPHGYHSIARSATGLHSSPGVILRYAHLLISSSIDPIMVPNAANPLDPKSLHGLHCGELPLGHSMFYFFIYLILGSDTLWWARG